MRTPKDPAPSSNIEPQAPVCNCSQDSHVSLPLQLRPKNKIWKLGFRHVTCPGCGLEYWTNREGDLRIDCQKKGI